MYSYTVTVSVLEFDIYPEPLPRAQVRLPHWLGDAVPRAAADHAEGRREGEAVPDRHDDGADAARSACRLGRAQQRACKRRAVTVKKWRNAVGAAAGGRATRAPGGAARADEVRVRAAPAESWHAKSSPPRLPQLFSTVGRWRWRWPGPGATPVRWPAPSLPEGARRSSCAVRAATVPLVRPSTRCSDLPTPMVGTPLRTPREDGTEAAPRRVQSSPAGRGPWTS